MDFLKPELQIDYEISNTSKSNTSSTSNTDANTIAHPDLMIENPAFEDVDTSKSKSTKRPTVREKDTSSASEGEKLTLTGTHGQFTVFPNMARIECSGIFKHGCISVLRF